MIIATQLRLRIGSMQYEITQLTLGIEDEAYVKHMLATFEPSTIYRPDGSTFEAIIFPAGSFRCREQHYNPSIDGWVYRGVESTAGWYVIDPEQIQPKIVQAAKSAWMELEKSKQGLFLPIRSVVEDSFKRIFG